MAVRIEDYALVGDCQTAALVGRDGSIDWLCLPRFDSGACFAALLGSPDNGRWKLAPAGEAKATRRRYVGNTLVLETEFETAEGAVALTDFMPVRETTPDLVRVVEGRYPRSVAGRPFRAAQPGVGGSHDGADHDQQVGHGHGQRGEGGEARHASPL